jgi:phosphatidate cytidylyltransferase
MAGGFYFFGLIATISAFALYEFYALAKTKGIHPWVSLGLLFGFCFNAVFIFSGVKYYLVSLAVPLLGPVPLARMEQLVLILMIIFVALVLVVELFRRKDSPLLNIAATVFGVCYVSMFLGSLIGLRALFVPGDFPVYRYFNVAGIDLPSDVVARIDRWGGLTVATVFASIWICDSAAYFVGRAFGRHKLLERVSPHKTWEGAVAGFAVAVLTFILSKILFLDYMTMASAIVCGCIVGLFGQVGDLVESMLKRDAGVKDSSKIIPGHGGVLDRFDSLILVSPLIYLYLDFIVF